MSASKRRQRVAALQQIIAQTGAGLGGDTPMGRWNVNQAQLAANYAQAEAEREAQKEAEKKAKRKKWGGLGAMVGGLLVPGLAPALGPVAGGALGSALGSTAGQLIGGGGVDFGNVLQAGATGGIAGGISKAMPQAATQASPTITQADIDAAATVPKSFPGADTVLSPEYSQPRVSPLVPASPDPITPPAPQPAGGGFLSRMIPNALSYSTAQQIVGGAMGTAQPYGYGGGGGGYGSGGRLVHDPQTGKLVWQGY